MDPREYAKWIRQNSAKTEEELRSVLEVWAKKYFHANVEDKDTKMFIKSFMREFLPEVKAGRVFITKDGKFFSAEDLEKMEKVGNSIQTLE